MHSKDLSELEGKARRDSMIRNLGDPIGVFFFLEIMSEVKAE